LDSNLQTNRKQITVFVLVIVGFMVSGSAVSANAATIQKLPTCVDPTGQNLPCMMVISTLPTPPNAVRCQETSGEILSCSYGTQNLSNGNQIVVITVYVPANFVFSNPEVIKVGVYKTTIKIIGTGDSGGDKNCRPLLFFHSQCPPPHKCGQGFHPTYIDGMWRCVPDKPIKNIYDCSIHAKGCDGEVYCSLQTIQTSCYDETDCPNASPYCTTVPKTPVIPAIDCTKTPNDPSCTQTLTPLTTPPTTKTCPDGSVIDASATCPTQSTPPPSSNSQPQGPDNNNPSASNNSPPSSSDNGNNNPPPSDKGNSDKGGSGSGSSNGGGGSSGGSNPPQPSTMS
jgi:uncharacterized membrane protein YgcG